MLYFFLVNVTSRLTNKNYSARSQKCLQLSLLNSYAVRGEDIWGMIGRLSVEGTQIPSISEVSLCGDGFALSKSATKSRRLSSKKKKDKEEEEEEEEEEENMRNTIIIKNSYTKKPSGKSTSSSASASASSSTSSTSSTSSSTASTSSVYSGSSFRGSNSLYSPVFNMLKQNEKAEEETESFDEAYLLNRLQTKRKEDETEEMNKLQDVVTNINNGYLKSKTKFNSIIALLLYSFLIHSNRSSRLHFDKEDQEMVIHSQQATLHNPLKEERIRHCPWTVTL